MLKHSLLIPHVTKQTCCEQEPTPALASSEHIPTAQPCMQSKEQRDSTMPHSANHACQRLSGATQQPKIHRCCSQVLRPIRAPVVQAGHVCLGLGLEALVADIIILLTAAAAATTMTALAATATAGIARLKSPLCSFCAPTACKEVKPLINDSCCVGALHTSWQ